MLLHAVILFSFFVRSQCTESGTNCFAKEKSMEVLDLANDTLRKLKHLFPNCTNEHPSANTSECGAKEKALALLEIATDLITEAKRNYPNCLGDPETDPVTEPVTVTDTETETELVTVTDTETETELVTVTDTVTETELVTVTDTVLPVANPMDCEDVLKQGHKSNGIYKIWPKHNSLNGSSILVYCVLDVLNGRGWTVIQRRGVNYTRQDFNQDWDTYKRGFGDLNGEFWLGNQNIYALTQQANYMLHIDLEDFNRIKKYASYNKFWIEPETNYYTLYLKEYTGNAGDAMQHESETFFTTKDRSHGKKVGGVLCVESRATGWWYWENLYCNGGNLNGIPSTGNPDDPKNLYWKNWKQFESLARGSMRIWRR